MKIAIACDFLLEKGGIERIVLTLLETFPEAEIFVVAWDENLFPQLKNRKVHSYIKPNSFFSRLVKKRKYLFLPLLPFIIEKFNFSGFDLVISVGPYTKGIIVKPQTIHINYCSTPIHYLWSYKQERLDEGLKFVSKLLPFKLFINFLRTWDFYAAQRPDFIIANSHFTQKKIQKYYKRESVVIYPPVNTAFFSPKILKKEGSYYLAVGRLVDYKRWELVIEAFLNLPYNLKICGKGPLLKKLKKKAKGAKNIDFLGSVSDENLRELYDNCQALIAPTEEDFGIAVVEAMSMGKPVIVYKGGGFLETVKEGITGKFFKEQKAVAIQDAILKTKIEKFNPETIRRHALNFSESRFKTQIKDFIQKIILEYI